MLLFQVKANGVIIRKKFLKKTYHYVNWYKKASIFVLDLTGANYTLLNLQNTIYTKRQFAVGLNVQRVKILRYYKDKSDIPLRVIIDRAIY